MPELPEVETIRSDLEKEIIGYTISDFKYTVSKMIKPSESVVRMAIVGEKIIQIDRKGKYLIVLIGKNNYLIIHLKMTGRLLVRDQDAPEDQWTRVIFILKKKKKVKTLRFADQRKFGFIQLINKNKLHQFLKAFGLEPFKDLTLEKFEEVIHQKKVAIKKVLLDQSIIAGIGNIYANEALFLSRIHPEVKASALTDKQLKILYKSILEVLTKGLHYRGASDNSYLDAFGKRGSYQDHFLVYRKTKNECNKCGTKITRIVVGGRGTFICPNCQKI